MAAAATSVVGDVVHCIRHKNVDQDVLHAFVQEIERSTNAKVLALRTLSQQLGLVSDVSESEVSSDTSTRDVRELVPCGQDEHAASSMCEEEVIVFFQFGLPLVQAFHPVLHECESAIHTILSAWASVALKWCGQGSTLELQSVLEPFLVAVCVLDTQSTTSHHSCLNALIDIVAGQSSTCSSVTQVSDRSIELNALLHVVHAKPSVFYTAMHLLMTPDHQLVPTPATMHRWVLLGHVVIQPWFDSVTFVSTPLWSLLVQPPPPRQGVATVVLQLWFLALFLPTAAASIWTESSSAIADVLGLLWHAIAACAAVLPRSLVPPSDMTMWGHVQLADAIPIFTPDQVHSAFATYWTLWATKPPIQIPTTLDDVDDPLPTTTFHDSVPRGYGLHQIELWIGSAKSNTTGGAGIRALRVTLHDGTLYEFITCVDVSNYEYHHQQNPRSRRTFVGAVRFTTSKHEYPWIGTPSRLANLDVSVRSSNQQTSDEVLVELTGKFDEDGWLVCLGGSFAQPTTHDDSTGWRPEGSTVVETTSLGLVAYVFRCVYALAPWECVSYFHTNLTSTEPSPLATGSTVQALFLQMRHHPRLFAQPTLSSSSSPALVDASAGLVSWLAVQPSHDTPPSVDSPSSIAAAGKWKHDAKTDPVVSWMMQPFYSFARDDMHANMLKVRAHAAALRGSHAKEWWYQRELKVEKEVNRCLHKQMHGQRTQILSFEKERRKWEHEVQRRISKYATDRKLSSEQNLELHGQVEALKLELATSHGQLKALTASSAALEGAVDELRRRTAHTQQLETQVDALTKQVAEWDHFHATEMDRLRQSHVLEMQDLKYTWSTALQKNGAQTRASSSSSVGMIPHEPSHEDHRVAELEKTIKQKV
ncbi:hypothetical protein DYB37_005544 [Aphanomyces astaci]|uniref:Uncharacterized protein n=1 Tax=Aphanomyces astaci TaxID=112090 RepID=A0A418F5U0_APHAT|nr:hypothetical protein DYB37_005544 [Aphanomyces astaci]